MIYDDAVHKQLFAQPSIVAAQSPRERDPSYISATEFSMAVLGLTRVRRGGNVRCRGGQDVTARNRGATRLPAEGCPDHVGRGGECRLSRLYRALRIGSTIRWTALPVGTSGRSIILLVVGVAIAAAFNVDTLRIAQNLTSTPLSIDAAKLNGGSEAAQQYVSSQVFAQMNFGWPEPYNCVGAEKPADCAASNSAGKIALKIVGLLPTAVALSLGAPFWFDTLSRFVNVRGSGPAPAKSAIRVTLRPLTFCGGCLEHDVGERMQHTSRFSAAKFSEIDDAHISPAKPRIVLIAGMGFFTDAYDLFIIGVVLKLLNAEWHISPVETALVGATALVSAAIGSAVFGRIAYVSGASTSTASK